MNKNFSDYYIKKLKKALCTTSTWVSIILFFFINLFPMKKLIKYKLSKQKFNLNY
ncbi:hypothetical protein [Clostridium sp. LCP25S3_F8]|uniref:hypothetical protein n=1 Tax=Clostridium sp. LCP25S3_F8 TaxID=3438751 RepID=UPI003F91BCBB